MKEIPAYSTCCEMPVLARGNRLYCHGCDRTILSIAGSRRQKALAELRWTGWEDRVWLMWRNLGVAYARDVPDYVWKDGGYQVRSVAFKWVSAMSIASSLFGFFKAMDYPGRDDFKTLHEAAADLRAFLVEREGEKAIPKLPRLAKASVPA